MPRFFVKIKGTPKIAEIEAATFEEVHRGIDPLGETPGDRVAKDADGNEIGRFSGDSIAAWWVEPSAVKVEIVHIGSQPKLENDKQS